ncbi:hypothetical protein [Novosphingobium humi]|uniref:Uncharacterized protein n=1 Tax=Novosphingobium humi TaxID=2282397 RepID=A0ABY7U0I8_9SPHN|nr:hypothetical protein [Novosphingobium humi]WCT78645.1 hypothetical protein PQ457_06695 [Novosphingobium humi]
MPLWLKWIWRLFIAFAVIFALIVAVGLWSASQKPKLSAQEIAEGRGCLDDKGSIPDMEAKVRAQFADPDGFRGDGAVELLRGEANDPAIPKDTSLALMRVAGKNRFGGLSFFSASGVLHIKDCTVTMYEVKEEQ